jgi:hypothetical protein
MPLRLLKGQWLWRAPPGNDSDVAGRLVSGRRIPEFGSIAQILKKCQGTKRYDLDFFVEIIWRKQFER